MTTSATTARTPRLRRLSGYAVLLLALAGIAAIYAAFAPNGHAQESGDQTLAIKQGQALFKQSCASCHGLQAQGGNRAPSLIGVGAAAVDFQVGTGRMPLAQRGAQAPRKQPKFNQDQINQLAAYVASLAPGPAIPSNVDQEYKQSDLAAGGELFRTNCSQCHNVVGSGGALTYGKYGPPLDKATPKQIYEAMLTGPESMPVFGDKVLTPQQKLSIVNYVRTIKTEANPGGAGLGRVGPVTEGLVAFLVGIGALVALTLWIGQRA